jgi:hypothetical protein
MLAGRAVEGDSRTLAQVRVFVLSARLGLTFGRLRMALGWPAGYQRVGLVEDGAFTGEVT